ncbi:hypothetical protein PF005_g18472 [Phytophthora fragariae]|uniref:Uncharacterized protein n=1 Tax=Phytophthora fragariae TaxID=53985 RepID=A0A6A3STK4_9STRA|nr:hypothetical protein PF003_g9871 [Phytophthora fragariae]KAE8930491.1 hypothetical protein PF009_g19420 [Phytophthora fragariae]KAE8993778.1 hypothetical protein PF011_g17002 [Phytophthora fragariae]KAE9092353.1 hypothetical protein PF007_g18551 [Phytophthora fragariae]KAE9093287.1 hypothetical protein PF010_g17532 [Phytophthora fragariae]
MLRSSLRKLHGRSAFCAQQGLAQRRAAAELDLVEAADEHVLVVKRVEADLVAMGDSVIVTDLVADRAQPGSEEVGGSLGECGGGFFLLGRKTGAQQC